MYMNATLFVALFEIYFGPMSTRLDHLDPEHCIVYNGPSWCSVYLRLAVGSR